MQQSDFKPFSKALYALGEVFGRQLTETVINVYFKTFADFTIEEFESACYKAINECKFFPKPVELRQLIEGSADERAQAAWTFIEDLRAKVGYYSSVWIEDAALSQALADTFGGWISFCDSMHQVFDSESGRQIAGYSDEMKRAKQKEFIINYNRALKFPRRSERYHVGHTERENRNAVGSWKRGLFPDGVFYQPLGLIIGGEIATVSLPCAAYTAQLTAGAREQLEAHPIGLLNAVGHERPKQIAPAPKDVDQNQSALVTSERFEAKRVAAEAVKRFEPIEMTEEEKDRRMSILREQARLLTADTVKDA